MPFCTVNGSPVLEGEIGLPRIGVWQADVELPAAGAPTGRVTLALGTQKMVGTVTRSGPDGRGRQRMRIVGGAGGFAKTLAPKSYYATPFRLPLLDVLTDAGEQLAPSADPGILAAQMPAWSRMSSTAGVSLAALVESVGAAWRVLLDGTVWIGTESWPASTMAAIAVLWRPEARTRVVASLAPTVLPGQTYNGERIRYVRHLVAPDKLRTELQIET
jgi:hypothetical protein